MDPTEHPTAATVPDTDTGDLIDTTAADPPPPPVDDPADPSWVEPDPTALPVEPAYLLPAYPDEPQPPTPPGHAPEYAADSRYARPMHVMDIELPALPDAELPPVGTSLPAAPDSLGDHLLRDQQLPADHATHLHGDGPCDQEDPA